MVAMNRIPLWFKIAYTFWAGVWFWLYAGYYPTAHFLWMCHVGNLILVLAFWLESPLLISWQANALLLADLLWTMDLAVRLTVGIHPIGATWYLFGGQLPLWPRLASLFHLAMPWLLLWGLWTFGYDRRAIWCQLASCWILFPLSYVLGSKEENINWVYGPFGSSQDFFPPLVFLVGVMVAYPIVVFIPSHMILRSLFRRPGETAPAVLPISSDAKV